jgi:transcriptional regulator with XRE-family HTH domain
MRSSRQPRPTRGVGTPSPRAIVRGARTAQGMTLAGLGGRAGYSAAQVSRYERGIAPLTDITLIYRFAAAPRPPTPAVRPQPSRRRRYRATRRHLS